LWGELTAEDHLYMFARLKNIPKEKIDSKIDEMLRFVNLSK
jgi:ABC-type multidrug transport system ATPase subunit